MTHRRTPAEVVVLWLASVSVAIISLGIVGLTATFWWPYDPLTLLEIRVVNTPHAGGTLVAEINYCKPSEAMPTRVRWTLINEVTVLLDEGPASLPAGCHVTQRLFDLSTHVPPARYRLQVEGTYEPWPWRRIDYLRRSVPFTIGPVAE